MICPAPNESRRIGHDGDINRMARSVIDDDARESTKFKQLRGCRNHLLVWNRQGNVRR